MNSFLRDKNFYVWVLLIIILSVGSYIGGYWDGKDEGIREGMDYGWSQGYNECKEGWIDSILGKKDSCKYESNENKTMIKYVCGQLTTGWREV